MKNYVITVCLTFMFSLFFSTNTFANYIDLSGGKYNSHLENIPSGMITVSYDSYDNLVLNVPAGYTWDGIVGIEHWCGDTHQASYPTAVGPNTTGIIKIPLWFLPTCTNGGVDGLVLSIAWYNYYVVRT